MPPSTSGYSIQGRNSSGPWCFSSFPLFHLTIGLKFQWGEGEILAGGNSNRNFLFFSKENQFLIYLSTSSAGSMLLELRVVSRG
jgi:hypothetical protein